MFRSAINKLQFDFTCSSETVASELQREISYYGLPDFQSIMEEVFGTTTERSIIEIDKIEIDLGNITLKGLSDHGLLGRFKLALENELKSGQKHELEAVDPGLRKWMIVKTYLLTGDLPWWVDKNTSPNVSHLISGLLVKVPHILWDFLESNSQNLKVQERIQSQLSLNIRKRLETNPAIFSRKEREYKVGALDAILNVWKSHSEPNTGAHLKMLMIQSIISVLDASSVSTIQYLGVLSQQDLSFAYEFVVGEQANARSIFGILDNLSLLQLEFLLQITMLKVKKSKVRAEQNSTGQTPGTINNQKIKSISNMLQSMDPRLLQELSQYNENDLLVLESFLKQYKRKNVVKSRLIELLLDHPFLLHYRLLFLPAQLSAHLNRSMEHPSQDEHLMFKHSLAQHQASFNAALGKLTDKDVLILNDINQKGNFQAEAERIVLLKLMQKLPEAYLQTMSKIAVLDKAEIEVLAGNQYPPANDDLFEPAGLEQKIQKIIVGNAGLVLIAAYLPALFNNLGFLESGRFKNILTRSRALYLLQYIATGQQYSPEYVLQFNKLLCGFLPEDTIVEYNKRLTKKEKEEAGSLLSSVIVHWKALKGTSTNGFRAAFIQRKGLLVQNEVSWILQVEKKSYDVLLDSIPWSFSVVKLPWMKKNIELEW